MTATNEDLLQQFIIEARDLLEQAGRNLLVLERTPGAAEQMNDLFRSVHTLKGTSGLFEIAPLTQVVHAAEDLLGAIQAGRLKLLPESTDVLLDAMDQVGVWIDALAETGVLPAGADTVAARFAGTIRKSLFRESDQAAYQASQLLEGEHRPLPSWLTALPDTAYRAAVPSDTALLALTYKPDAHCFFRGEDPLALIRQVPGLRLLRVEPAGPWPAPGDLDPFACNLHFHAIAAASPEAVNELFRYVSDQLEIVTIPSDEPAPLQLPTMSSETSETFEAIFVAQQRLLSAGGTDVLEPGRFEAAASALRGAVRYASRNDLVEALEMAIEHTRAAEAPGPLLAFLTDTLKAKVANPAAQSGSKVAQEAAPGTPEPKANSTAAPTTLRVEQSKIDALMNLIGELVVAKNALAYLARRAETGSLTVRELAREIKDRQTLVNRIAEEMQSAVMAVRMLPVEHVFQRFPRLVRDIARRLNKRVELIVEGGETEADKNVIEALADPLIHMVRNSLDHGIEMPDARLEAGKPEHGTIRLQASQDNDDVVIRVIDDGRGIDPSAVRSKAIQKGILDADRAASMADEDALRLVFAPGFSTAEAVSDLSGRGVGMDVVRSAVEKAGGQVSLSSQIGQGTTIELRLPLSLAVTRIMTVECGTHMFGVSMAAVVETVRVPRKALRRFRDREAFVLRESVVPVVRLARLLDLPQATAGEEEAILVVRLKGERLGLVVSAFREGMEVIVKPLEGVLAGLPGFAGTTLLGDGRVLLILNLPELVH